MNLVNELQISAEQDDVLTVLRKTMRLASKLNRQDISEWLRAEQSGYPGNQNVPDYRKIRVTFAYNTNGPVPIGFNRIFNGVQSLPTIGSDCAISISHPISTVQTWITDLGNGQGIYMPVEENMDRHLRTLYRFDPMFSHQITLMLHLNASEVRAIPDRIKDKVLEWSCALESAGVTGEGMSFTAGEKEIARSITFNINGSHIEQLTNLGTNNKGNQ